VPQSPKQAPPPPPPRRAPPAAAPPGAASPRPLAAGARPLRAASGPDGGGQEIASPTPLPSPVPAAPREPARLVAPPLSHAGAAPHAVQVVPQTVPPSPVLQSRLLVADQTHVAAGQEFHPATSSSCVVAPVPSVERLLSAQPVPGSESDATVAERVEALDMQVQQLKLHVVKQSSAAPGSGGAGSCRTPPYPGPCAGMQQNVDRVPDDMRPPIILEGSVRVAEGSLRVAAGVRLPPHPGGGGGGAHSPAAAARAATPEPSEAQRCPARPSDGGGSTSAEFSSPGRRQRSSPITESVGTWSPCSSPPPTCKLSAKTKRAGSSVDVPVASLLLDYGAEAPAGPDQESVQVLKAEVAGLKANLEGTKAQLEDVTESHRYLELQMERMERKYREQGEELRSKLESQIQAQVAESLTDARGRGGGGSVRVRARGHGGGGARLDSPDTTSRRATATATGASRARLDSPENSASRRAAAAAAASKGASPRGPPRGPQAAQRASPRGALGRAAPPPRR